MNIEDSAQLPVPAGERARPGTTGRVGPRLWLRLDPMTRWMGWIGPIAVGNAMLFLALSSTFQLKYGGVVLEVDSPPNRLHYLFWACLLWMAVMIYLASPASRTRCAHLPLALPVSARFLWRTHVTTIVSFGLLLLAATGGALRFVQWLMERLTAPDSYVFEPRLGPLVIRVTGTFLLAAMILQAPSPLLQKIRARGSYLLLAAAVFVGGLALIFALGAVPLWVAAVPAAAAVLVGVYADRLVPPSLSVMPREPEKSRSSARRSSGAAWVSARPLGALAYLWRLYSLLWRESHKKIAGPYFAPLIGVPILFLLGFYLAGGLQVWLGEDGTVVRFFVIPMVWYTLVAFLWQPIANMHYADALPISRRALFAVTVLPSMLALGLSFAAGWAVLGIFQPSGPAVEYRELDDGHHYVLVPWASLEIAWDGQPPENASPWGESHQPAGTQEIFPWGDSYMLAKAHDILPGGRAALYSPFSTPEGSSIDFVALQISRAVEAVHGVSVPPEEIRRNYLALGGDGRVVPAAGVTLLEDHPELQRGRTRALPPFFLLAVSLPWFFLTWIFLAGVRAGVKESRHKARVFILMGACMLMYLGGLGAGILGFINIEAFDAFIEILVGKLGALPGGTAIMWAAAVILLVAGYLVAQSRFLKIEAAARPSSSCVGLL